MVNAKKSAVAICSPSALLAADPPDVDQIIICNTRGCSILIYQPMYMRFRQVIRDGS